MALDTEHNWKIKKGDYKCRTCSREFTEEEEFFSTLFETQTELERRNYCPRCWSDEIRDSSFSFWQTRMHKREGKKKILVDDDVIFNLFERFIADENDKHRRFGFILSLILMRKKKLKFDDIRQKDQTDYMILRRAGSDETFEVEDPHLDDKQILEVKEELARVVELPQ